MHPIAQQTLERCELTSTTEEPSEGTTSDALRKYVEETVREQDQQRERRRQAAEREAKMPRPQSYD